jgi:hypothetical protein
MVLTHCREGARSAEKAADDIARNAVMKNGVCTVVSEGIGGSIYRKN